MPRSTTKKRVTKRSNAARTVTTVESAPKFPYTTRPGALRTFLEKVPDKPRPTKVNPELLKSWGIKDTNAQTIIRVLKALALVAPTNEPTDAYSAFMDRRTGPAVLGTKIRSVYQKLFEASKEPYKEAADDLKSLFNIHSGGKEETIALQIQTFKSLCEYARFDEDSPLLSPPDAKPGVISAATPAAETAIHIDLHIHLPENKGRRDYEYMFEDIGRYILGRPIQESKDAEE